MLGRPRVQPIGQILLGVATLVVVAGVAVVEPARLDLWALVGLAVILAGCVAMVLVWRGKPAVATEWIAIVPLVDIVACIPVREAGVGVLPGAGFLLLFPVGWLAFAFPLPFLVAGLLMTAVIPVADALRSADGLDAPARWATILTLPVLMALYAATIAVISRDLRVQRIRAVDARTRMSDALRSSALNEATMVALADAVPDGLVVFDAEATPLLVNAVAQQWARRARVPASIADTSRAEIYEADRTTRLPVDTSFFHDLMGGGFAAPSEVWVGPPGDQIAVRFSGRPVIADGELVAFVLVGTDVTELRHAVEVRDRFLDAVGHELRSPLTVILGNAQLARDDPPERSHQRWDRVDRSAERLLRLVDRLILGGREAVEARSGDVDVSAAVRRAVAEAADLAEARTIDFEVIAEGHLRASITERDLTDIVAELATNAVRFTPAGGSIVVDARTDDGAVIVEVADTGVGMTSEERGRAFDRFFRGAAAHDGAVQGVGIGLSIARRLAEANGAELSLEPGGRVGTIATLRMRPAGTAASGSGDSAVSGPSARASS